MPLGPFLGINNRLPDFALQTKDGAYLREADNVDVTNAGTLRRRRAAELVQAIEGPHSLHGNYYAKQRGIYQFSLAPFTETQVYSLQSNAAISYADFGSDTYFSNGTDSGRIDASGFVWPWAMPTPDAPEISAIAGALFKGKYQVAVSHLNALTGEESGVSPSTSFELEEDSGLRISLPASATGSTHVNVYVSTVNGSVPLLQRRILAGTASVDIASLIFGREAQQRYEAPMPAGGRVFFFNGRLCSVDGNTLYYGLPFKPGYYLPAEGYIQFPADISVAIGNQGGVYVVADKTYFLSGADLGGADLRIIDALPYGAVPGTEFMLTNKPVVGWFGAQGIVLADTGGGATAAMSDNIDVAPPVSGISIISESGGFLRVASCGWCLNLDSMAATTYSGFDFTSASNGYGTKADGLYLLEGSGAVDAVIGFGRQNFGAENMKHMPAAYIGSSAGEALILRVTTPTGEQYDYPARERSASVEVQRIDTGKGLRANWFDLKLLNAYGADFTLASVSFAPVASQRRI